MGIKIVFLTLLLSLNSSYAKTLIVSDVDDTVKVTDVLNKRNMVYNALFSKAEFSGMSELYREMNLPETTLYYVSGSPKFLEEKVGEFLEFNKFPQKANLILKQGLKTHTYDYKVETITNLINKTNPDKVILIGDDTEFDPEVYETISKKFPSKVESIYIRAIQDRELPKLSNIRNFFSAAEVAGLEVLKGNLKVSSLVKVAASFIKREKGSKIVIKERYCPSLGRTQIEELKQSLNEQSSIDSLEKTQQKIVDTCHRRSLLTSR
ncbi:MAG: phosphatase domain-containing protein [Bacteriovorax sp.]|jgi:hypothetical protein